MNLVQEDSPFRLARSITRTMIGPCYPPLSFEVTSRKFGTRRFVSRYRGTSLIRSQASLGPYSRTVPGPYGSPRGGAVFMSEVAMYQMRT
jgi:hypothetical protein